MSEIIFSCIIPASTADVKSYKLNALMESIKAQDFPQDQIEILVITDGDSEQAKAIGIREAEGEICAMFCADNYVVQKDLFKWIKKGFDEHPEYSALYPSRYYCHPLDNSLNRYFSLIGGNDPICYYLGKNDRESYAPELNRYSKYQPSYGCNGFFYRSELIKATDLDHYYPMDNALEVPGKKVSLYPQTIWHRTSDNLISFLIKRYKYARDLYCDRNDRRWKIIDTREDYWKLGLFILATLTGIQPLYVSLRGYKKIPDFAWFWHWPVCIGVLITYGILTIRNVCSVLSSYPLLEGLRRLGTVLSPCGPRLTKTSK